MLSRSPGASPTMPSPVIAVGLLAAALGVHVAMAVRLPGRITLTLFYQNKDKPQSRCLSMLVVYAGTCAMVVTSLTVAIVANTAQSYWLLATLILLECTYVPILLANTAWTRQVLAVLLFACAVVQALMLAEAYKIRNVSLVVRTAAWFGATWAFAYDFAVYAVFNDAQISPRPKPSSSRTAYADAPKPPWAPEPHVFMYAWTFIYICMAFTATALGTQPTADPVATGLFLLTIAFNVAWPCLFSKRVATCTSLLYILLMLAVGVVLVDRMLRAPSLTVVDKIGAAALSPYLLWLVVAARLSAALRAAQL